MDQLSQIQRDTPARNPGHRRQTLPVRSGSGSPVIAMTGDAIPMAIGYSQRKWGMPVAEPVQADVESYELLGHPTHYRGQASNDLCKGHYEFCGLGDGFFVHVNDVTYVARCRLSVLAPDMLRVRIASADDLEYIPASESGDRLRLKGPGVAVIIEPRGQSAAQSVVDGHTTVASIYIHRSTLKRLYTNREHELPMVVQAFVAGTLDRTIAQPLPLGANFLRCLEDLTGCELEGHGRRLFFRSKAVEILCHAFKLLGQGNGPTLPGASVTTRRGVLKAQRLLNENFVTPPSLDDLAHAVNLSRTVLSAGFRLIVGQTVFDYIAELRMHHALTLLIRRDTPITQIAYEVGFSHPSSFSQAVQRRYGSTPRELRRRSPPIGT